MIKVQIEVVITSMMIHVLGVRGSTQPWSRRYRRHSGVLIDNVVMLDCGEPEFLEYEPKIILITHLHADHAFFVERKMRPPDLPALTLAPESVPQLGVKQLNRKIQLAGYEITPLTTIHSNVVVSQAYLLEREKARLLYTGDLLDMKPTNRQRIGKVDLVITEASFFRAGGMVRTYADGSRSGHAGVEEIVQLFMGTTKKMLFMHFGSWFYRNIGQSRRRLQQLGTKYGIEVLVAYEGMKLNVE